LLGLLLAAFAFLAVRGGDLDEEEEEEEAEEEAEAEVAVVAYPWEEGEGEGERGRRRLPDRLRRWRDGRSRWAAVMLVVLVLLVAVAQALVKRQQRCMAAACGGMEGVWGGGG